MNLTYYALLFAGSLFLGMLLLLEAGRRMGARRLASDPEGARIGLEPHEPLMRRGKRTEPLPKSGRLPRSGGE